MSDKLTIESLKAIAEGLRGLADRIDEILNTWQQLPSETKMEIEGVTDSFPEDLRGMLSFEDSKDSYLIRPRHYLGVDNFARIAAIVRDELKGRYISAGKDSHFEIK